MRARRAILAVVSIATAGALALVSGTAAAAPAVIDGTSGSPLSAAAVALDIGGDYACSGSLWRPRILLTAAHCLQKDDGSYYAAADIRMWAPGSDSSGEPSAVHATQVIVDPSWSASADSADEEVGRDFAALILDQPLGQPVWSRMATPMEAAALTWNFAKADFVGYGITTPRVDPNAVLAATPTSVRSPLLPSYESGIGAYAVEGNERVGTCGGDSGGPWMSRVGGALVYLGPLSGGQGLPCDKPEPPGETWDEGAVASANRDVTKVALAAVGEQPDQVPTTCIKGKDVGRTCWEGRAWEYSYCWSAKRAELWRWEHGKKWTMVDRYTARKDSSCGRAHPYLITFRQITEKKYEWFEVYLPPQAGGSESARDTFKATTQ